MNEDEFKIGQQVRVVQTLNVAGEGYNDGDVGVLAQIDNDDPELPYQVVPLKFAPNIGWVYRIERVEEVVADDNLKKDVGMLPKVKEEYTNPNGPVAEWAVRRNISLPDCLELVALIVNILDEEKAK